MVQVVTSMPPRFMSLKATLVSTCIRPLPTVAAASTKSGRSVEILWAVCERTGFGLRSVQKATAIRAVKRVELDAREVAMVESSGKRFRRA